MLIQFLFPPFQFKLIPYKVLDGLSKAILSLYAKVSGLIFITRSLLPVPLLLFAFVRF